MFARRDHRRNKRIGLRKNLTASLGIVAIVFQLLMPFAQVASAAMAAADRDTGLIICTVGGGLVRLDAGDGGTSDTGTTAPAACEFCQLCQVPAQAQFQDFIAGSAAYGPPAVSVVWPGDGVLKIAGRDDNGQVRVRAPPRTV